MLVWKALVLAALCPAALALALPAAPPRAPARTLHDEAAAGDANAVDLLLAAGMLADDRNDMGSTPLHLAALHGHEGVAEVLLAAGAPANAQNDNGNTPLHAAAGGGHAGCAQLLLANGADAEAVSSSGARPLHAAAQRGDAAMLSALLGAGAVMDEDSVQHAFWRAVQLCETKPDDAPLSADVPVLLRHVFDADLQLLQRRERLARNVTCMQPAEEGAGINVINDELTSVALRPGRACVGGECCEACSRVTFPVFATHAESDAFVQELQSAITPPLHQFSLQKCAFRDMRTTLLFVRFVERMRRAIAAEYGLRLATVLPLQTFVSCFVGAGDKQGGLHSDESTHAEFHYSCVMYLSTQHEDFEGGTFAFSDPPADGTGPRVAEPLSPSKGSAIIFSSGWENIHEVEPLVSGTRFAVPSFFGTIRPEQADALEAPTDDGAIAAELWRTLLFPDSATEHRQFMMNWHGLLAAGR